MKKDRLDIIILLAACFFGFMVHFGFYGLAAAYAFGCMLILGVDDMGK